MGDDRTLGSWPPERPPCPYSQTCGVPALSRTVNAMSSSPGSARGRIHATCEIAWETPLAESQTWTALELGIR